MQCREQVGLPSTCVDPPRCGIHLVPDRERERGKGGRRDKGGRRGKGGRREKGGERREEREGREERGGRKEREGRKGGEGRELHHRGSFAVPNSGRKGQLCCDYRVVANASATIQVSL